MGRKIGLFLLTAVFIAITMIPQTVYGIVDLSDAAIDADEGGLKINNEPSSHEKSFIEEDFLAPGDAVTRSYIITNSYSKDYELYVNSQNPQDLTDTAGFISAIRLELMLDGEVIYRGSADGSPGDIGVAMEDGIYLGLIDNRSQSKLTATFSIPEDLGNEYQNAHAKVEWKFTAHVREEPEKPAPGNDPGSGAGSGQHSPGGRYAPKTGDLVSIAGLLFMTVICLLIVLKIRKRGGQHEG